MIIMKYRHMSFFAFLLLWCSGCAETTFFMKRPSNIPTSYHYVGGPDGGNWVKMEQKSPSDYIITTFTRNGPSSWLFRLEGPDPLPEKVTERDLNGWDGVFMHVADSRLRMRRIRRID